MRSSRGTSLAFINPAQAKAKIRSPFAPQVVSELFTQHAAQVSQFFFDLQLFTVVARQAKMNFEQAAAGQALDGLELHAFEGGGQRLAAKNQVEQTCRQAHILLIASI